jgi:hypothetical protein
VAWLSYDVTETILSSVACGGVRKCEMPESREALFLIGSPPRVERGEEFFYFFCDGRAILAEAVRLPSFLLLPFPSFFPSSSSSFTLPSSSLPRRPRHLRRRGVGLEGRGECSAVRSLPGELLLRGSGTLSQLQCFFMGSSVSNLGILKRFLCLFVCFLLSFFGTQNKGMD